MRARASGLRQPEFGGFTAFGEMEKLHIVADVLHDTDLADLRAFDDAEDQAAVDAVSPHDRDEDDAALPKLPSCRVKHGGDV